MSIVAGKGSETTSVSTKTEEIVSIRSGFLNTLTDEQRLMMYQFWAMLQLFISQPYDKGAESKIYDTGRDLYEEVQRDAPTSSLSAKMIDRHPLAMMFFRQAITDDLDTIVLRFLRARKWNLPAAFAMLGNCCEWRAEYGIHQLMKEGEARIDPNLMVSGKGFVWEEDKRGRVCCYVRGRLHDKNAQSLAQTTDYLVYWLEVGRYLRRYDEQLVTIVMDLSGIGLTTFDTPLMQFMFKCLQAYYPEILGQVLIIGTPWIFWGFWKLTSSLIDPVVASKIKFIKAEELPNYIDKDRIPIELGGQSIFSYDEAYHRSSNINGPNYYDGGEEIDERKQAKLREIESKLSSLNEEMLGALIKNKEDSIRDIDRQRAKLKDELRQGYHDLLRLVYPPTMYHRLGVFAQDGRVDWSLYTRTRQSVGEADYRTLSAPSSLKET